MGTLIEGLRQAGAAISDQGRGALPFTVHGTGSLPGGRVQIDAAASSQFVSALLLAGARFDKGLELVHDGAGLPSLPHIEMTVTALRAAGVSIDTGTDTAATRWQVSPGDVRLPDQVIEPDLSNAAPFLAAALVTGGSVTVPYWPATTSQPGALLAELLRSMGATVTLDEAGLTVTGTGTIAPLVADLHDASELTPVLAALAALADGESVITGVAHIRGHETDRLAALATELTGLGGEVTETADGLVLRPAALHGGPWRSYADHRMAQAGAVLGLAVPGVEVDDIGCTSKTLADFPGMWQRLLSPLPGRRIARPDGAARHQAAGRGRRPQPADPPRQPGPDQAAAGALRRRGRNGGHRRPGPVHGAAGRHRRGPCRAADRDAGPRAGTYRDRRRRPGRGGR